MKPRLGKRSSRARQAPDRCQWPGGTVTITIRVRGHWPGGLRLTVTPSALATSGRDQNQIHGPTDKVPKSWWQRRAVGTHSGWQKCPSDAPGVSTASAANGDSDSDSDSDSNSVTQPPSRPRNVSQCSESSSSSSTVRNLDRIKFGALGSTVTVQWK